MDIVNLLNSTAGVIVAATTIAGAIFAAVRWGYGMFRKLDRIYEELIPNGGGSLADAIHRIEAMQVASMQLTGKAYWVSDPSGKCTFASARLSKIMGVNPDQILGYGWVSVVAIKDREACRREWDNAVKDCREFHMRYSYNPPDGSEINVVAHAVPVVHPQLSHMVGMIGWVEIDKGNDRCKECDMAVCPLERGEPCPRSN